MGRRRACYEARLCDTKVLESEVFTTLKAHKYKLFERRQTTGTRTK